MDRQRILADLFAVVVILLFLTTMYLVGNIKVWIFTDVAIITFVIADLLQGRFTDSIEKENRKLADENKSRFRIPRSWYFVGFLFGIFLATVGAGFFSLVYSSPTFDNLTSLASLTVTATALLVFDFYSKE